jgi:NAD(P)-dependent dehydrogenase (short-subunit alcohol dehydrogenase family)
VDSNQRVAIITGAASGIGFRLATALLEEGMLVAAVDRNPEGLDQLSRQVANMKGSIFGITADLEEPASFAAVVNGTLNRFGGIDVLINNAGIGQITVNPGVPRHPVSFWDVTPEQWNRFVRINFTGPVMLTRAVLPHMLERRAGRIITVTTSLGSMLSSGLLLYGAPKAGTEAAMAVLAADLSGTGVSSNILVPGGAVSTGFFIDETVVDRNKLYQPDIMVPPLLWLISEEAVGVTARRFVAVDWDESISPGEAAVKASAPIAWLGIARPPILPDELR